MSNGHEGILKIYTLMSSNATLIAIILLTPMYCPAVLLFATTVQCLFIPRKQRCYERSEFHGCKGSEAYGAMAPGAIARGTMELFATAALPK